MARKWTRCSPLPALVAALLLCSCKGGGGGATGPSAADMKAIGEVFALAATTTLSGSLAGAPARAVVPAVPDAEANPFPDALEDFQRQEECARGADIATLASGALARAAGGCGTGTATGACPAGGNVTATLQLSCTGPSGCCGRKNPCSQDSMHLQGQGTETFNDCRSTTSSGDVVAASGALATTLAADATVTCYGAVNMTLVLTLTGTPTFTVNGREVCSGPTSVKATVTLGHSLSVRLEGTICGEAVDQTYSEGCVVACGNNKCCPMGTRCSTCANSCPGVGWVDCCNGSFCPPGTRCVAGNKCQYR